MVREDNKEIGQTTVFNYDTSGNILSKSVYTFALGNLLEKMPLSVIPYSYRATIWRDQMTAFNGEKCEYDEIGYPTKYRSHVTQFMFGGRMTAFDNYTYAYNAAGERVSKTVNGLETKFITASGKVVRSISNGTVTDFFYDNYGLSSIRHNGVSYFVRKNVLGDVTHIYDTSGNLQARYVYDVWGNHRVLKADGTEDINLQSIGNINPIRYRGYYYDTETKLYYLKARYYDPKAGRFISADSTQFLEPNTINGLNLYVYCANNPIMNSDSSGCKFFETLKGIFVQTVVSVGTYIGACVRSIWDKDVRADMNAIKWNPFNTDANLALNANKVSFYYGVPVYNANNNNLISFLNNKIGKVFGFTIDRPFTFTSIFMFDKDVDTLNHEIGHIPQQMLLGQYNFFFTHAIPSMAQLGSQLYYDKPWEITASIIGGGTMDNGTTKDKVLGWAYLALSYIRPILTPIFWFL